MRQSDSSLGRLEPACENASLLLFHVCRGCRAIESLLFQVDAEREGFGIKGRKKVADCDLLIVGDGDVVDGARHLGGDLHEVGADIGVRRIGNERDRNEIEESDDRRRGEDEQTQTAGPRPRGRQIVLRRS